MSVEEEGFRFPPCWQDDERMNSLFAPFRAMSINPTDWNSKMSFWESLIEEWCLHHKSPFIKLSVLNDHFRRQNRVPSCLPEVIQYLLRDKKLMSRNNFYQMTEQSWKNWAAQMIINQLQWPINKMKDAILKNNENSEIVLIHWPVTKKLGQEIMESIPNEWRGKLLNINQIQETSKIKNLEVLQLIFRWLESQKLVALHQCYPNILVKFPKDDNGLDITEIDKAFYSLEMNKTMLENYLHKLELERDNLLQEARKYVSAKKLVMAKKCLRRKRAIESLTKKLGDGIENIESLLYEMQMAQMANVILQCYETGVNSLKNYFKQNGLTLDRVLDAKSDIEGVLTYASDIDNAVTESVNASLSDEFSEDLERELEDLLKEDNKEKDKMNSDVPEIGSILDRLPQVPTSSPSILSDEKLEKDFANLAV